MAVSRAAVLQSLVLDESLRQYQTAAVNSVQNLASTFTGIAHALQKQKVQSSQYEQGIQKQLNALIVTINEHAATIEDMKADQNTFSSRMLDRIKYDRRAGGGGGALDYASGGLGSELGPLGQKSLLDRIRRIEQALDIVDSDDEYFDDDEEPADYDEDGETDSNFGNTSDQLGQRERDHFAKPPRVHEDQHLQQAGRDSDAAGGAEKLDSSTPTSLVPASQSVSSGRRANNVLSATKPFEQQPNSSQNTATTRKAKGSESEWRDRVRVRGGGGVGVASPSDSTNASKRTSMLSPNGAGTSIGSRLETLEYKQKQFEAFLRSQSGSHVDARLQAVLTESEPAVIKSRAEAAQKLDQMSRALERMEETVKGFADRMQKLESMVIDASEQLRFAISDQAAERSRLGEHVSEALERLEETRNELRERTEGLQSSVNAEIEEQARTLGEFQQKLESKADIRLVLDKITRQEWQSVVSELRRADEEILSRAAARSEVEELVLRLRSDLTEEEQQRSANIVRIANDLKALMSEVSSKASKSDLVDVANVLNSFPKVHADLDSLKLFVESEIASKQDLQLLQDATVTRRGLRRQLDALLKSLAEEIHRGERAGLIPGGFSGVSSGRRGGGGPCTSCATRTASGPGGSCLVCSAKLLAPMGVGPTSGRSTSPNVNALGNPSFVPMKGGGYALSASPRRIVNTPGLSASGTSIPPPGLNPNGTQSFDSNLGRPMTANLTDFIAGKSHTMNAHDLTSYPSSRSVVGTDGKLYTSTGTRTHSLHVKK